MVKIKVKDIAKFLNTWDREIYDLNMVLKKMNKKQKKEQLILQKKEGHTFGVHK
jgi:hypothetical protein|tara:strand:- start:310 stop:471 length:162 start_codon:yes stop_codon:yes gene_type:complete